MVTKDFIEGIGNEVLLCSVLLGGVILSVAIRLYNRGINRTDATPVNTQNSNSSVQADSEVVPNEEEIDRYEAGVIDDTHEDTTPNKESYPEQGTSSEGHSERAVGIRQQTRDLLNAQGHIIIRLQYLNDQVRYVHAPPSMPIIHFKRKFFSDEILRQNKNVRLIFQGRELTPHGRMAPGHPPANSPDPSVRLLRDYGVGNESTIHCLVTDMPAVRNHLSTGSSGANARIEDRHRHEQVDLDIGTHAMLPLFALIIGSTWIFRFTYVEYFNLLSTVALIILSGLFGGAALSIFFRPSIASIRQVRSEPAAGDAGLGNAPNFVRGTG